MEKMRVVKIPEWSVGYVVGLFNHERNTNMYFHCSGYSTDFKTSLHDASPMCAEKANKIVENNLYRGCKLVYKKDRKKFQTYVSKVFVHRDGVIKLTKNNAFQLMEVVANNI
jgi:hypothetical protein